MAVVIAQLSDIHLQASSDAIFSRQQQLSAAINAEASSEDHVVLLYSGDLTDKGQPEHFVEARRLLDFLLKQVAAGRPAGHVVQLAIPGNHDCDLSGDQDARDLIVSSFATSELQSPSKQSIALGPLTNYFAFQEHWLPGSMLSAAHPYYSHVDLHVGAFLLRFHLLNSAWMSTRHEKANMLCFPLDVIVPPTSPESHIGIGVLHHPYNWFKQPEVMRPLRDRIEQLADIVFTGHEHSPSGTQRRYDDEHNVVYFEGGELQSRSDPNASTFTVVRITLQDAPVAESCSYTWRGDHYERKAGSASWDVCNRNRSDGALRLSDTFAKDLDDPELPFVDAQDRRLKLQDIYVYPDLRDCGPLSGRDEWRRVRADQARDTLLSERLVAISGSEASGKSAMLKMLFRDLRRNGKVPVLLNGRALRESSSEASLRALIGKAVKLQYESLTLDRLEQLPLENVVLLIDDFGTVRPHRGCLADATSYWQTRFCQIIVSASEDFFAEEHLIDEKPALLDFKQFSICEFGYLRIEALANRWLSLIPDSQADGTELSNEVVRVCKVIERTLKSNAIPHYPWILLVLLRQVDSAEEPAAKNGSYGHLYNAVITAALARSAQSGVDIKSKYTYLGHFAFELFSQRMGTLDDAAVRAFHDRHCAQFDLSLDYGSLIGDLVDTGILRNDQGTVAFRAKYSYCFFLAWYLAQQIHRAESKEIVRALCQRLFHDESANTVVFLAHLCSDPTVIQEMQASAKALFADKEPIRLEDDVKFLDELHLAPISLSLPESTPEENRRQELDTKDEKIVGREPIYHDGRSVTTHPDETGANAYRDYTYAMRASRKTIQILGQVLRNEVGSLEATVKHDLVREIFQLARRIMGDALGDLEIGLPRMLTYVYEYCKEKYEEGLKDYQKVERAQDIDERAKHASRQFAFGLSMFFAFEIVRHLAESVGFDQLSKTFARVLEEDDSKATRVIELAIDLGSQAGLPRAKAVALCRDLDSQFFTQTLVRLLVRERLYLYDAHMQEKQAICADLEIEVPKKSFDPQQRKFGRPH